MSCLTFMDERWKKIALWTGIAIVPGGLLVLPFVIAWDRRKQQRLKEERNSMPPQHVESPAASSDTDKDDFSHQRRNS